MKKLIPCLGLLLMCSCARFSTTQIDHRENVQTGEITTVTTKAASYTFFASTSRLASWKAEQSEDQQGAEVGDLNQESTATNLVDITESVSRGVARGVVEGITK